MNWSLRPAIEDDRPAILALMRPRDYNRINLKPGCFVVAINGSNATTSKGESDGGIPAERLTTTVIGIGQVKRHWDGTAELASLVVAEHCREQGVGGSIVRALVKQHFANADHLPKDQATEEGPDPLYLFCLSALAGYYQRFGFQQVARSRLPWPLYLMHLLGNSIGRLAGRVNGTGFSVIAMKIDASSSG